MHTQWAVPMPTSAKATVGRSLPGKMPSAVGLSQDIYHVDRDQITNTNIDLTMVDGEIAYYDYNAPSGRSLRA